VLEALPHALLTCLERSGPIAVTVAQGLAVLGDRSSTGLLARLCGLTWPSTVQGLRVLQAAGLVEESGFRHAALRSMVREDMPPERQRDLHSRAAGLLHQDGAPAAVIAAHLKAAERVEESWGVSVLQEAAEELLADDRDRLAIEYLERAHAFCQDPRRRADIRIRTAVLSQRSDPFMAECLSDDLLELLRNGRLTPRQGAAVVDLFVCHRRIDEANQAVAALRQMNADTTAESATGWVEGQHTAVVEFYQPWSRARRQERPAAGEPDRRSAPWGEESAAAAEELLQRLVLTDSTLVAINNAIKFLMCSGKVERARYWADTYLQETERRGAAGWYAMLAGIRAETALLMGQLRDADQYSQLGLDRLPERKRGILACGLVATQVMAHTAMGNYETGARRLNQPTPETLFGSEHGLLYLRARGMYNLATNRLNSALNDFLTLGRLARNWGMDHPSLVPWRGDVAEALIRLGDIAEAERILTEQLSRIEDENSRISGVTLRLLSATAEVRKRPSMLTRAIAILQGEGDRLQLANALCELAEAHRKLGETSQATTASRRAWQLAKECGAEPLCARIRFDGKGRFVPGESSWRGGEAESLSGSEKRVAVLAACGYSNRDISSRLHITVSTVEQHLTRVYRKLMIEGREQLPVDLQFEVSDVV
jgi:DNA-binding CsgD family transcriptional regulator